VVRTIRVYRETIVDVCAYDPWMAMRVQADDAAALDDLLDLACARTGVPRVDYEAAIRADLQLLELQRLSLREVVAEPPDPGPYSEISRESPTGTPANDHLVVTRSATGAGLRRGR
jgi:hypothetical protein